MQQQYWAATLMLRTFIRSAHRGVADGTALSDCWHAGSWLADSRIHAHCGGKEYDISFPDVDELRQASFRTSNRLGKVPVLTCPDGQTICETLAINRGTV